MLKIVFIITGALTALIAGLFYAYSCSANIGLGRLSGAEYLRAMQAINRSILNPWFFASFMGTLIALPVSTWLFYQYNGITVSFYLLLAASAVYIIGVFGVTIFGNVPLNEALDKFNIAKAGLTEIDAQRAAFELPWNRLNLIRTLANILSLILFLTAVIKA